MWEFFNFVFYDILQFNGESSGILPSFFVPKFFLRRKISNFQGKKKVKNQSTIFLMSFFLNNLFQFKADTTLLKKTNDLQNSIST